MSETETRTPTKQELKKQQQYFERRQRMINKGVPEDQVDMAIAREDYEALPTDKKIKRLEQMVQGLARGISQDITNLIENDRVMADTYDINVRVIKRLLTKVGLEPAIFDQVANEVEAEWKAEAEAQEKAKRDAAERSKIEEALQAEALAASKAVEGAGNMSVAGPVFVPEAATTFGG